MRIVLLPLIAGITVPSNPLPYPELLARIERDRMAFQETWRASDVDCRDEILEQARGYLLDAIGTDLFDRWYGTPWDFNGTTRVPGEGHIACGYFVTTILQDAGFRLPRVKWAQLAAEPMILKMAPTAKRFRDRSVTEVETWLSASGDGLYAVGLDNHVGFILRTNGSARFVHSSFYGAGKGVMNEALDDDTPFAFSRYRVIGKLLDDEMVRRWIEAALLGT